MGNPVAVALSSIRDANFQKPHSDMADSMLLVDDEEVTV